MGDMGDGHFERGHDLQELQDKLSKQFGEKNAEERIKNEDGIFHVGEEVELKGSRFRVKSIKPKELRLKLLPRK